MRKKLYLFPLFLLGFFMLGTTSCLDTKNDDDAAPIDEEWKSLNESIFAKVVADRDFTEIKSKADNGSVYWDESDIITKTDEGNILKITVEGKPEFTDTVAVRYEGWYLDKTGKKIIFDSTENLSERSRIDYIYGKISSRDPNYTQAKFAVNGVVPGVTNGVVDGWKTILQDMKLGEERIVCIPQELAYGSIGSTYKPTTTSPTFTIIPAYTTLWFRLKIYKIIPMKGVK